MWIIPFSGHFLLYPPPRDGSSFSASIQRAGKALYILCFCHLDGKNGVLYKLILKHSKHPTAFLLPKGEVLKKT